VDDNVWKTKGQEVEVEVERHKEDKRHQTNFAGFRFEVPGSPYHTIPYHTIPYQAKPNQTKPSPCPLLDIDGAKPWNIS